MFDQGDLIKGYAPGFGIVTGHVVSEIENMDILVEITRPTRWAEQKVWVNVYGQPAIPSAKLVSKEQQA